MNRALVIGEETTRFVGVRFVRCWLWIASHECARGVYWTEHLTEWHNAFWAADHHVRYDCGYRSPSSGIPAGIETGKRGANVWPFMQDGSVDMGALHGLMPGQPWVEDNHEVLSDDVPGHPPFEQWSDEGGMQNTPTPFAEQPTVEFGKLDDVGLGILDTEPDVDGDG